MESDQMRFIFQHSPPCSPHTSISVEVLGSHWSKVNNRYDMNSSAHSHIANYIIDIYICTNVHLMRSLCIMACWCLKCHHFSSRLLDFCLNKFFCFELQKSSGFVLCTSCMDLLRIIK